MLWDSPADRHDSAGNSSTRPTLGSDYSLQPTCQPMVLQYNPHRSQPHLHSSGVTGCIGADLEQADIGCLCLPTLSGRPTFVNDHWFVLEEAHEVIRLFSLDHTNLRTKPCDSQSLN